MNMNDSDKNINKLLENIDNIPMLDDKDLKEMDFYELAYYVQSLNQLEDIVDDESDGV